MKAPQKQDYFCLKRVMARGRGVTIPPKNDDIYEQPLTLSHLIFDENFMGKRQKHNKYATTRDKCENKVHMENMGEDLF